MADTIKNSYLESNRFQKVVMQRGREVLDFELNELQDNIRVQMYRTMQQAVGTTTTTTLNPGTNSDAFKVSQSGVNNQVRITGGTATAPLFLFVDGIPIPIYADTTVSMPAPNAPGGGSRIDYVYISIQEVEVADPEQIPKIGETSRRLQMQYTLTGATSVPASDPGNVWDGSGAIHHYALATVTRPENDPVILDAQITDQRKILPPSIIEQVTEQTNFQVTALVQNYIRPGDTAPNILQWSSLNAGMGDRELRLADASTAGVNVDGFPYSIVRSLNSKGYITVGDGTISYGDFTGVDAIGQAIDFYQSTSPKSAARIVVKSGTYNVAAAGGYTVTNATLNHGDLPQTLIIEGESSAPYTTDTAANFPKIVITDTLLTVTDCAVSLKNLVLQSDPAATAYLVEFVTGTECKISIDNCHIISPEEGVVRIYSHFADPEVNAVSCTITNSSIINTDAADGAWSVVNCAFTGVGSKNMGSVIVRDCFIDNFESVVKANTGLTAATCTIESILVDNCRVALKEASGHTGIVDLSNYSGFGGSTIHIPMVTITNCKLLTSAYATTPGNMLASIQGYNNTSSTTIDKFYANNIDFEGVMCPLGWAHIVSDNIYTGTSSATKVMDITIENVRFNASYTINTDVDTLFSSGPANTFARLQLFGQTVRLSNVQFITGHGTNGWEKPWMFIRADNALLDNIYAKPIGDGGGADPVYAVLLQKTGTEDLIEVRHFTFADSVANPVPLFTVTAPASASPQNTVRFYGCAIKNMDKFLATMYEYMYISDCIITDGDLLNETTSGVSAYVTITGCSVYNGRVYVSRSGTPYGISEFTMCNCKVVSGARPNSGTVVLVSDVPGGLTVCNNFISDYLTINNSDGTGGIYVASGCVMGNTLTTLNLHKGDGSLTAISVTGSSLRGIATTGALNTATSGEDLRHNFGVLAIV